MYYVYILKDSTDKNYVGYSSNLKQRIEHHKHKKVDSTKNHIDSKLIWYCAFKNKERALIFEKYLKRGSGHAFLKKHLL